MKCNREYSPTARRVAHCSWLLSLLCVLLSISACRLGNSHPHSAATNPSDAQDSILASSSPEELIRRYEAREGIGIPRGARAVLDSTTSVREPSAGASKLQLPETHPLGHKRAIHPLKENLTAELLPLKDERAAEATPSRSTPLTAAQSAQALAKKKQAAEQAEERIAAALAEQSAATATTSPTESKEQESGFGLSGIASAIREKANALLGADPEPSVEQAEVASQKQNTATENATTEDSASASTENAKIDAIAEQLAEEAENKQASVELLKVDDQPAQANEETSEEQSVEELVAAEQELARGRLRSDTNEVESSSLFWEFAILAFLVALFFLALWLRLEKDYSE